MRTRDDIIYDLYRIYSCMKRAQENYDRLRSELTDEENELNDLGKDRMELERELLNCIRSEV